jgi:plasmid stability protein
VKTTVELPDELYRAVKVRAAHQGRKLKDVMAELIRRGLSEQEEAPLGAAPRRARLPLVTCAHPAAPGREVTPERAAEILAAIDVESLAE